MDHFELVSEYAPTGDQPQAIEALVDGFKKNNKFQTLLGIPGTANGSLPDTSLHYVPFTYAGTVDAYKFHHFIEKYELVQGKAPGGRMGWMDPKQLQIPKTGDSSVLGLWGISLCTSLAGCLALTAWKIRRRE